MPASTYTHWHRQTSVGRACQLEKYLALENRQCVVIYVGNPDFLGNHAASQTVSPTSCRPEHDHLFLPTPPKRSSFDYQLGPVRLDFLHATTFSPLEFSCQLFEGHVASINTTIPFLLASIILFRVLFLMPRVTKNCGNTPPSDTTLDSIMPQVDVFVSVRCKDAGMFFRSSHREGL